ncbi:hypothetical protein B7P43_G13654 [Cryptotermes secundus]|uniref:Uncharacterized protein n=2 Tax=Cryptotermes secundus TaxID=105785 RepID=A0A2J7REV9_9NEOP|nr:uncharacterized protein LOC111861526 isoform X2 [Cryptotermes secundus]PNF39371.1 hypothetical protein B7P43_G13654 [Cryptotermes secundus]
MDTVKSGPGGVLSEIVDKVSFANFLPLLTRATAENEEPTAGYMFKEIEKITFQVPPQCQQLAEYLNRRLEKPSACVKLKELLDMLFNPDLVQQDDTGVVVQTEEKGRLQLGGLGSTGNAKGKYEGFGSSPVDREETIKGKMMDMLEKFIYPTDETAEKIKSAMTSSPGHYEAVRVNLLMDSNVDIQSAQAQTASVMIKAHVPGHAGGGWESDEDIPKELVPELQKSSSTNSGSIVSVDSLEKIDSPAVEVVKETVNQFCNVQEWPTSLSQLNDACKTCATLNCGDVLQAIGNILLQSSGTVSDISLMRALLMLEWFLRTDLITPAIFSKIISAPLNCVLKSQSSGQDVKVKAQKIRLILDKLQP